MLLEHNTYKEAISDIRLSEERGMEMMENTMKRKEQWSQKWKAQMVAIAAGIAVIILSVNGICFAATGMNAWDLLQSLYRNNGEEAEMMSKMFRESGETLTDGNLQFMLERYWYDKDNGMAYFTIRTDSLDGSRLDDPEVYVVNPRFNSFGSMTLIPSEPVLSEDGTSFTKHYSLTLAYVRGGEEDSPNAKEGISQDTQVYTIVLNDGGLNEHGFPTYKKIGQFILEPTGTMPNLQLDGSSLEHCVKISLTGGGLRMFFDTDFDLENGEEPFNIVEIKMKDGTTASVVQALPEGNWEPILGGREGVEIIGYKSDTVDMSGERYLGSFSYGGGGSEEDHTMKCQFISKFNRFINIDDVESVSVDGVELPIIK